MHRASRDRRRRIATKLAVLDTVVADDLAVPRSGRCAVRRAVGHRHQPRAPTHCQGQIRRPGKTQLILVTDHYEGGDKEQLLARAAQAGDSGVNLIVLLALNDAGRPGYDPTIAQHFAALGAPVFACTPDLFPS